MIGPGWLPSRPISRLKKRTLAYVRVRRRRRPPGASSPASRPQRARGAPEGPALELHAGPVELPTAMLVPRGSRGHARAFAGEVARWLVAKWAWLRPRAVPVMVAALGLLAVLESADYLRHVKTSPPHDMARTR